jgi:hypothetical protein
MWHVCMLRGPEGGRERGREGMRPTTKVDLQCVDFGVEGKPVAETTDGRGGDRACISKEERAHLDVWESEPMMQWRDFDC